MMIYSATAQERKNVRHNCGYYLSVCSLSLSILSDIILKAINNIFEDWKHKQGIKYMYLGTDLCHLCMNNMLLFIMCLFHSHYERKGGKERRKDLIPLRELFFFF